MRRIISRERDSKMDGKTRVCGLIANPVEHSMSPLMQNFYGQRTGVNMAYVPFKVEEEAVGDAVRGAYALNILGLNVTVPHKQRVMEYLADIDEDARAIGAVNTLVRVEGGYKGYNTDGAGLRRALDGAGIRVAGEECILIGAGGAAKAAAYVLAKGGAKSIYILNRNTDKARVLADYINGLMGRPLAAALPLDGYGSIPCRKGGYLAVQSTSVGMHPHVDDVIIRDRDFYELIHTGVDIVYTPARTRFMELVEEAGGQAVNGLDMLLYQGIIAYELWNPKARIDEETVCMARRLIRDHLSGPETRHNLILIGFMGAGKTSVGDCYAREYGLPVIDTDQRIEAAAGMSIPQIFETQGEEGFRRLETEVLEELLAGTDNAIISVGGGLPLREENRTILKKLGCVVYLDVSPKTVMERVGSDVSDRPMLQGDDVESRICDLLNYRRPIYLKASHVIVDVNGRSVEDIAGEIHRRAGI